MIVRLAQQVPHAVLVQRPRPRADRRTTAHRVLLHLATPALPVLLVAIRLVRPTQTSVCCAHQVITALREQLNQRRPQLDTTILCRVSIHWTVSSCAHPSITAPTKE
jgi:hypothetical protein